MLRTKIALLYKSYIEWDTLKDSYVPLKGEVCFCEVPAGARVITQEPAVLYKVGDGVKTFAQLPWASAIAADVYDWAKKENLDFSDLGDDFKENLKDFINTYVDLSKKVDKEIVSDQGKARIFNEADGGGAKFENKDGTASFAGVNNDTNGGIGAQLYDIDVAANKGSKLDVTKDGIFYTRGDESAKPAAQRDVAANELATMKDIAALGEALHYIGMVDLMSGETIDQALARVVAEYKAAHPAYTLHAGAVAIIATAEAGKEYIYNGTVWQEFGDEGIYETKEAAAAAHAALTAEINKKVSRELNGANGKAEIFNESDGGGAKFTHNDGSEAYVGVNDGGKDGMMAQIYADVKKDGKWSGSRINVYNDKIYYTNQEAVDAGVAKNDADHEIATVGDIAEGLDGLAEIAHTGNVNDLVQDDDDVLILNCNF